MPATTADDHREVEQWVRSGGATGSAAVSTGVPGERVGTSRSWGRRSGGRRPRTDARRDCGLSDTGRSGHCSPPTAGSQRRTAGPGAGYWPPDPGTAAGAHAARQSRTHGSAGRAAPLQGEGRRFESVWVHRASGCRPTVPAMQLADVVAVLEEQYPPALAESWDAVGLVCGDPDADVAAGAVRRRPGGRGGRGGAGLGRRPARHPPPALPARHDDGRRDDAQGPGRAPAGHRRLRPARRAHQRRQRAARGLGRARRPVRPAGRRRSCRCGRPSTAGRLVPTPRRRCWTPCRGRRRGPRRLRACAWTTGPAPSAAGRRAPATGTVGEVVEEAGSRSCCRAAPVAVLAALRRRTRTRSRPSTCSSWPAPGDRPGGSALPAPCGWPTWWRRRPACCRRRPGACAPPATPTCSSPGWPSAAARATACSARPPASGAQAFLTSDLRHHPAERGARGARAARRRALGDRVAVVRRGGRRAWPPRTRLETRVSTLVTDPFSLSSRSAPTRMKADPFAQLRLLDLQALDSALDRLAHRRRTLPELAEIARLDGLVAARRDDARAGRDRGRRPRPRAGRSSRRRSRRSAPAGPATRSGWRRARSRSPSSCPTSSTRTPPSRRRQGELEDRELEVMEKAEAVQAVARRARRRARRRTSRRAAAAEAGRGGRRRRDRRRGRAHRRRAGRPSPPSCRPTCSPSTRRSARPRAASAPAPSRAGACGGCRLDLMGNEKAEIRAAPPDEVLRHEECTRIMVRTAESGLLVGRAGSSSRPTAGRAATPARPATAPSSRTPRPARCSPSGRPASAGPPTTSPSTAG